MVNRKVKGTIAERDIIHKFWKTGVWVACRVAGSGSSRYPSPDVVASNNLRKLVLEIKATQESAQYVTKDQIEQLRLFATRFGAEPWLGVRFDGRGWYFVSLEDLRETGASFVLDYPTAQAIGMSFDEMTGTSASKGL